MELLMQLILKVQNITIYHIIALAIIVFYGVGVLVFKYLMRNHPKIENSDGTKEYR